MNRMEEYQKMVQALEPIPPSDCVAKAIRRRRRRGAVLKSLTTVAAVFCLFVGTINFSPRAAAACSHLPVLGELIDLLVFRPSIRMAVEHDYLQSMNQQETKDDITASVEYLVVDQKQINLYYRLRSDRYQALSANPEVRYADGNRVRASISHGGLYDDNEELREITVDFMEDNVPDTLVLELSVYDNGVFVEDAPLQDSVGDVADDEPKIIAQFSFTLCFDPFFTAQGEQFQLNRQVELDGQCITISGVEIYPSHIRIEVVEDPENRAKISDLDFDLELDNGETISTIRNGITATGSTDDPYTTFYRAESSYFAQGDLIRMNITGADFLDLDREAVRLDLRTLEHDPLPEGVRLSQVRQTRDGWAVSFGIRKTEETHSQLLKSAYEDGAGTQHDIERSSYIMEQYDDQGNPIEGGEEETYYLDGVTTDQVTLHLNHNRYWEPTAPVVVELNPESLSEQAPQ